MIQPSQIDQVRRHGILSSRAGAPFLAVYGVAWLVAAVLTFWVPREYAPWCYPLLGLPAAPIAIALERRVGFVRAMSPDPLLPLTLQLLFVQIVAFPAILLVWDTAPAYMPVAFAAVVGAHFLPFQWVYRTPIYGVLAVAVAVGPFLLALVTGQRSLHFTGFFVGAALLVGAFAANAHAKATWLDGQGAADPVDGSMGPPPGR